MTTPYADPLLAWFARHARDLPWRAPGSTPWSVLVSEIMLQQTPVARVVPAHQSWLARWPTPAALAAEPAGEVRRVAALPRRLAEAERMGFRRAIVPAASAGLEGVGGQAGRAPQPAGDPPQPIEVVQVEDVRQALSAVLGRNP